MKAVKIIAILFLVYIGLVVAFESSLGYYQPGGQGTLVITTTNVDGEANDRVLSRIDNNGQLYVAANHWPRAWFNQALENPKVQIKSAEEQGDYLAVGISGEEHDRVNGDGLPLMIRILTGFPPRYFVRLDPQ